MVLQQIGSRISRDAMRTVVLDAQMDGSDVTREMISCDEGDAALNTLSAARLPRVVVAVAG